MGKSWKPRPKRQPAGLSDSWRVEPGQLDLGDFTVEPDLSNAPGPFLAAALVTGGSVTIRHWPKPASLQVAAEAILDVIAVRWAAR